MKKAEDIYTQGGCNPIAGQTLEIGLPFLKSGPQQGINFELQLRKIIHEGH